MSAPSRLARDPLWRAIRLLDVRWRRVAWAVVLGTLALGSAVGLAAVAAWLIARASQMPPVLTLSVAVVAVRAFGISRGVFRYLERLASHDLALRGMGALRTNLYIALASGPSQAVVRVRRGDLLARVGADVDAVGDVVVRALIPAGVAVCVSLGSVVLVGAFLPTAGLALFGCLLLTGVLAPWLAARSARTVELRGATARAEMTATTLEILESSGPLSVSGRLSGSMGALRAADRELAAVNDDGGRSSGLSAALLVGSVGLAVLASILLGLPAVTAGSLAPVELSVIVLTPLAAFEAAGALPAAAVQLRRSREAARRIVELLEDEPTSGVAAEAVAGVEARVERSGVVAESSGVQFAADDDALVLDDVSCGWSEAVVTDVNLRLEPGRAVALVGPSGVGKTTLLMTVAGLLPPVGGTVRVGGPSPSGRGGAAEIVFVAEDGHVFDTSVLENLRVARGDVTVSDAEAALDAVGLGPWLAGLPDGLDTVLGPDATTVSGGERRRLLAARALVAPARFLAVDEPAEHLDPETADALVRCLVTHARTTGRGVVIASHRLSTLGDVDEVLMLGSPASGGPAGVVARGTHRELLDRPDYRWALEQERIT